MKQKDIISAYKAVAAFTQREKEAHKASLRMNHAIFKTRKLLEAQHQFQLESEQNIYNEFSPKQLEGNLLDFGTPQKKNEFFARLKELEEMDVDLGPFEKPVVSLGEEVSLDPDEIAALDPFIEFTE